MTDTYLQELVEKVEAIRGRMDRQTRDAMRMAVLVGVMIGLGASLVFISHQ